jgi:hypothetical protein
MTKKPLALAISLALTMLASHSTQAATKTWACTAGNWSDNCWGGSRPADSDQIWVGPVSSTNTTLTLDATTSFNGASSAIIASTLTVNSTTANSVRFAQAGSTLWSLNQYIGCGRCQLS